MLIRFYPQHKNHHFEVCEEHPNDLVVAGMPLSLRSHIRGYHGALYERTDPDYAGHPLTRLLGFRPGLSDPTEALFHNTHQALVCKIEVSVEEVPFGDVRTRDDVRFLFSLRMFKQSLNALPIAREEDRLELVANVNVQVKDLNRDNPLSILTKMDSWEWERAKDATDAVCEGVLPDDDESENALQVDT